MFSAAGLAGALMLDGAGDAGACLGLAAPLVAIAWHGFKKPTRT